MCSAKCTKVSLATYMYSFGESFIWTGGNSVGQYIFCTLAKTKVELYVFKTNKLQVSFDFTIWIQCLLQCWQNNSGPVKKWVSVWTKSNPFLTKIQKQTKI